MKMAVSTRNLVLNVGKKIVNCSILSITFHGAEKWIMLKVDKISWKVVKCGTGEGLMKSAGPIM
jgi:hypothetical protein